MIGAHNTLTAYRALTVWGWLFTWIWRCQSKKLNQLINEGVHMFDIRVCRHVDRKGREYWTGAHGPVSINISPMACLLYIHRRCLNTGATVRLILERGHEEDRRAFVQFCSDAEKYCPAIRFTGGRYKPTWEQLYKFSADLPDGMIEQHVGSMDPKPLRRLVGKICPRLWHRLWGRHIPTPDTTAIHMLADFL